MSLAIAAHSLSEALENVLKPVHVVVDTPSATAEMVKSNTDDDFLNIFLYRVAPSTVHAAQTSNQPFFLRVFALLTPFARREVANGDNNGNAPDPVSGPTDYPDLQILSEVIRHFHENPVSDVMHAREAGQGTAYRIHAIPQAPEMEELNHIWTTQNSAIGYRLSAAFEFSLIPVDTSQTELPAPPVRSAMAQVEPDLDRRDETPSGYAAEFLSFPGLTSENSAIWDGPIHLPQILIAKEGALVSTLEVEGSASSLALHLAGPAEMRAVLTTRYFDASGQELNVSTSRRAIDAVSLADPAAAITHTLSIPEGTTEIVIEVRGATRTGGDLTLDRVGNTLTLTVTEAP